MNKQPAARLLAYRCRNCGSTDVALVIHHLKRRRVPNKLYYCQPCFDSVANLSCATCDLRDVARLGDSAPNKS